MQFIHGYLKSARIIRHMKSPVTNQPAFRNLLQPKNINFVYFWHPITVKTTNCALRGSCGLHLPIMCDDDHSVIGNV